MWMRSAALAACIYGLAGCALFGGGDGEVDGLVKLIEQRYVQEVDPDTLTSSARAGLLGTLDPYSNYLDESEYAALRRAIDGEFGGVGILIGVDSTTAKFRIKGTLLDSPAREAGIKQSDVIVTIDGTPSTGRPINDIVAMIQGKVGTTIDFGIERSGAPDTLQFTVRRSVIHTGTVRGWRRLPSGQWDYLVNPQSRIGYLRILSFADRTPSEFEDAVTAIHEAGARSFVLDLRGTPGGLARAAIEIADRLLDSGVIVTIRHRNEDDDVQRADAEMITTLPLAVLIDEGTASSAEILASALQDNERAMFVGSRSFGKGVGQELFELGKGRAVKLTTFAYLRPSGRPMERHFQGIDGQPFAGADSTLGGVWPDSGLTVTLALEEYERWSNASWATDDLLMMAEAPLDSIPNAPDRVLDRAVQALREITAR